MFMKIFIIPNSRVIIVKGGFLRCGRMPSGT